VLRFKRKDRFLLIMAGSTERIEEYIKKEIRKSGFPLEIVSSIILGKHGWFVIPHILFYNEETKEYNELDIRASKKTKGIENARDVLIIQCKKQTEKPWLFFQQNIANQNVLSLNITPLFVYGRFEKYFKKHYYFNKKPCSYHFPSFVSKGRPDVILEAVGQVLDALRFFANQELDYIQKCGSKRVSFFYPVIILDGRLFSARVEPDGDIKLDETAYLQLKVTRALEEIEKLSWSETMEKVLFIKDVIIDIVRKEYLEEFLKNFS